MKGEHYFSQKHRIYQQTNFDLVVVQFAPKTTHEIDHFLNAF